MTHNGWTGGQYSVLRALVGMFVSVQLLRCMPQTATWLADNATRTSALGHLFSPWLPNVLTVWPGAGFLAAMLITATILSILFSVGFRDRLMAVILWYLWACLASLSPLAASSFALLGWFLWAHICFPAAPYGSWDARQRLDPGGGWSMPQPCFALVWGVMACGYSAHGIFQAMRYLWGTAPALASTFSRVLPFPDLLPAPDPLVVTVILGIQGCFAPLALFRRVRPWLWCAMLALQGWCLLAGTETEARLALLLLHLLLFDPAWLPPLAARQPTLVFYDGQCGLCHRTVRFALAEDRTGQALHFAPLNGEKFERLLPVARRDGLPDSLLVLTPDGALLSRSSAVLHLCHCLGGLWRALAFASAMIPRCLRDAVYDFIASIRYRLFSKPEDVCPLLPPSLRKRFEL
jgi:predicted DCC family thiol-disulfide oxidoreductase YuxK